MRLGVDHEIQSGLESTESTGAVAQFQQMTAVRSVETRAKLLRIAKIALETTRRHIGGRQATDPRAFRQNGQAWNSYSSSVFAGRLNVATPSPTNPAVPSLTSAGNAEVANCEGVPCL